jgi:hypothetical protein
MLKHQIREKVNAAYGYNAIARIKITQTAETGFENGNFSETGKDQYLNTNLPNTNMKIKLSKQIEDVKDKELRAALADLEEKVLTKSTKIK